MNNSHKHVHWLIPYDGSLESVCQLNLASIRLRAGCMVACPDDQWTISVGERIPLGTSHCIVGKIGKGGIEERKELWLTQLARFKKSGGRIILDFTDNHLNSVTALGAFYRSVTSMVDTCVCSSQTLKNALAAHWPGQIHVIPDPIEIEPVQPKSAAGSPASILWFGHATNVKYLVDFLPRLQGAAPLRLMLLTNIEGIRWLQQSGASVPPNLRMELALWSVERTLEAGKVADLCIIPSDPADAQKSGASSNRLITALALGLPVAASMLGSYQEFASYFVDIQSGRFNDLLRNPLSFSDRVKAAQREVVPAFQMGHIARDWYRMLGTVSL